MTPAETTGPLVCRPPTPEEQAALARDFPQFVREVKAMKWTADEKGVVWDEAGRPVCVVGDPDEPLKKQDRGNLALIVAAPDLVKELEETAAWLEERVDVLSRTTGRLKLSSAKSELAAEVARLRGGVAVIRQTILQTKGDRG